MSCRSSIKLYGSCGCHVKREMEVCTSIFDYDTVFCFLLNDIRSPIWWGSTFLWRKSHSKDTESSKAQAQPELRLQRRYVSCRESYYYCKTSVDTTKSDFGSNISSMAGLKMGPRWRDLSITFCRRCFQNFTIQSRLKNIRPQFTCSWMHDTHPSKRKNTYMLWLHSYVHLCTAFLSNDRIFSIWYSE
jgi:hypothetical protein